MTEILINVVLDGSGSMSSIRQATVDGFNKLIAEQKKLPGALVSLMTFNTDVDQRYVARPIDKVDDLDMVTYLPNGGTALLDAVMRSITATESLPTLPERVLFVIITDGEENSSREVTLADLKAAIERKNKDGWEFSYLAANVGDFLDKAAAMGIAGTHVAAYYSTGKGSSMSTGSTWTAISTSTTGMRSGAGYGSTLTTLKDDEGYVKTDEEEEATVPTP